MWVIGLDLGTQSVKAVVCDDALAVRGHHAVAHPTSRPAPDHVEQDPRAWEVAMAEAIAGALREAGVAAGEVVALAIAGQLDGCVPVDTAGAAVGAALIWEDRRAAAEATRVAPARVFELTGQVADPSHLAAKIAWLRAHGSQAARFHQPVSYLVERLTGASVIDPALASTTMLAELATGTWSPELLAAFAICAEELPAILPTCAVAGTLTAAGARATGLRKGIVVAVGTGDDFANPLGAGLIAPGSVACVLGTAEVVGAVSTTVVLDRIAAEPMVETHRFLDVGTGPRYFVEHPGWLSGGAVRWATTLLGLAGDAAFDAAAATVAAGADGLTFVPALAGAMTPVWRPTARGLLHGLTARHGAAHVARAVLEGLAFACRDVIDRLVALGLPVRDVHLLGGGARSTLWAQLRADTLGLPHRVLAEVDCSPIGAAMIASVAAGTYRDLAAAVAARAPASTTVEPGGRATRNALADAYDRYQVLARLVVSGAV